jgi:hypothetical protein
MTENSMRNALVLSLAIAATLYATAVLAQSGASINKVQEREIFNQDTKLNNQQAAPTSSGFAAQCSAVLGLDTYCGCLGKDMPAGVGFDNFVVVLTRSKQDNGYDQLDATSKRAYDAIPALRDKCAAASVNP